MIPDGVSAFLLPFSQDWGGATGRMAYKEYGMKLKLDDKGNVVVQDGKPVYIYEDGKEAPFDAVGTAQTIQRLNGEAKSHREKYEEAAKTLKTFEGISDPAEALKAMNTVANLDAKKLVDSGEVDKLKSEISASYETKLTDIGKSYEAKLKEFGDRATTLEKLLYDEKIGGSFARSKFVAKELVIPSDMVQSRFGDNFKVEEGRVVAYDQAGNKIYSRQRPAELAEFDEALETLIDQYPYKDSILKSSGASGGGASNTSGGGSSNRKTLKREAYFTKSPVEQAAFVKDGGQIID